MTQILQYGIDVHAGNAAAILHQKNISSIATNDTVDHMTSRNNNTCKASRISIITSAKCYAGDLCLIAKIRKSAKSESNEIVYGRSELYSRADTCCAGATSHVIEYKGAKCEVQLYNQKYKAIKDVPLVKAATAYDALNSETYIPCMN
jgi:hypothetical protein